MKELEELTAEIRKKLPRLMELESGQIIRSLIEDTSCIIDEGELFTVGKGDCTKFNENSIEIGGYIYIINKDFEIVGKDPMLNDVLEWFAVKEITGLHFVTNHFINFSLHNNMPTICGKWDLSKPFLKDQSPELIKFLYGFIKH